MIAVTGLVVPLEEFHEYTTPHGPLVVRLELAQACDHLGFERIGPLDAAECDRRCELHVSLALRLLDRECGLAA